MVVVLDASGVARHRKAAPAAFQIPSFSLAKEPKDLPFSVKGSEPILTFPSEKVTKPTHFDTKVRESAEAASLHRELRAHSSLSAAELAPRDATLGLRQSSLSSELLPLCISGQCRCPRPQSILCDRSRSYLRRSRLVHLGLGSPLSH